MSSPSSSGRRKRKSKAWVETDTESIPFHQRFGATESPEGGRSPASSGRTPRGNQVSPSHRQQTPSRSFKDSPESEEGKQEEPSGSYGRERPSTSPEQRPETPSPPAQQVDSSQKTLQRSPSRNSMIPTDTEDAEEYEDWPTKINPPKLLDVLGTSVVLRCAKIANAKYTFQVAKSKVFKNSWKDAQAANDRESCTVHGLEYETKYHFRVRIMDEHGINPPLVSPPTSTITLPATGEAQTLRDRFRRAQQFFDSRTQEIDEEKEHIERELLETQQKNEHLTTEIQNLENRLSEVENELAEAERQVERLQSENDGYKRKNNEYEQTMAQLREQLNSKQQDVSIEYNKLQESLRSKDEKLREKDEIINNLKQMKQSFDTTASSKEMEHLRESLKEKEQELLEARTENRTLRGMFNSGQGPDRTRSQDTNLEREVFQLRRDIEDKDRYIKELENQRLQYPYSPGYGSQDERLRKAETEKQHLSHRCEQLQEEVHRLNDMLRRSGGGDLPSKELHEANMAKQEAERKCSALREDVQQIYRDAEATVDKWQAAMRRIGIWIK